MRFDPNRRVYVGDNGKDVPPAKIRGWIDDYIDSVQEEIDSNTTELLAGTITVAAFFLLLREAVIAMHGASAVIAYGGEDNVKWDRIGDKLAKELDYLNTFEREVEKAYEASQAIAAEVAQAVAADATVPAGLESVVEDRALAAIMQNSVTDIQSVVTEAVKSALADSIGTETAQSVASTVVGDVVVQSTRLEDLIWGEVGSRGRMYADSVYSTYENSVKAREGDAGLTSARRVCVDDGSSCEDCPALATTEYLPLNEVADIGDSQCSSRCRCWLEFDYAGIEPLTIDRNIYAKEQLCQMT